MVDSGEAVATLATGLLIDPLSSALVVKKPALPGSLLGPDPVLRVLGDSLNEPFLDSHAKIECTILGSSVLIDFPEQLVLLQRDPNTGLHSLPSFCVAPQRYTNFIHAKLSAGAGMMMDLPRTERHRGAVNALLGPYFWENGLRPTAHYVKHSYVDPQRKTHRLAVVFDKRFFESGRPLLEGQVWVPVASLLAWSRRSTPILALT